MPRVPLMTARQGRPDEPLLEVDHAGLTAALTTMLQSWGRGVPCPSPDAFVEKVKAVDEGTGEVVGFNYYVVWDEPQVLGKMRQEEA